VNAPVNAVAYDGNGKPIVAYGGVTAVAVSRDGRHVVRGRDDATLLVDGRERSLDGGARSVQFVGNGARFVTATSRSIKVWRTSDAKPVASIALPHKHELVKAVASPDGRQVVALLHYRRADVYALPSGRLLYRLTHDGFIEDVGYSPDGRFIVSGGYDGDVGGVRLWDARTGRLVRQLKGALLHVHDVDFSDDGSLVAAASADGTARIWETETGTETAIMIGHQNEVTSVDFNHAGTALVSASSDGTARVWGAAGGRAGRLLNVLAGHRAPLTGAVFSPDGRAVLTGGEDGTARVWDPGSEPALTPTKQTDADALPQDRTSAASLDGELRARGFADGTVRVTEARSGRVLWARRRHTGAVHSVSFSRDGKLLASASADHDALIWDVKTGAVLQRLHGHFGPVTDAEFSPDGRWVVTAGPTTAGLWPVGSNAERIFLDAVVKKPLSGATFAGPDGRTIFAASRDGSLLRYYCDICGDVRELIALARRRLAAEAG
jgi:WD40 repeat protein